MNADALKEVLRKHALWLQGDSEGERADLTDADLTRTVLRGADLTDAALTRTVLRGADLTRTVLRGADLTGAVLRDADLTDAALTGAVLRGAKLAGTVLRDANLTRANLTRTVLRGADLTDAIMPEPDLAIMLHQPGQLRAFKLVGWNNEGIYRGGLKYEVGSTVSVEDADTDRREDCAAGINVATLDWCRHANCDATHTRILILAFTAKDIACIPYATDGKFRLHRAKVVGECKAAAEAAKE